MIASVLLSLAVAVTLPPVFSAPTGHYTGPLTVTVTAPTPKSVIYCTFDGTTPATSSARYTGPVTLRQTTLMKCGAWVSGGSKSTPTAALYHVTNGFQISPAAPVVTPATTVKFTTVPAMPGVTWSASAGTMGADGTWISPPCSSSVTQVVIAARISCDDVTTTASLLGGERVTGVAISPAAVALQPGQAQQFTATVSATCP